MMSIVQRRKGAEAGYTYECMCVVNVRLIFDFDYWNFATDDEVPSVPIK